MFTSHFLASIGLCFCPQLWVNSLNVLEIIKEMIPNTLKITKTNFNRLNLAFQLVRNFWNKPGELKRIRPISGKLEEAFVRSIIQGSIVIEKSYNALEKLQNLNSQSLDETTILKNSLMEIDLEAKKYSELVTIIYKVFKMSLNIRDKKPVVKEQECDKEGNENQEIPTIRSDDPESFLKDEEFEGYSGDFENIEPLAQSSPYGDEKVLSEQRTLLLDELRQSLKQNKKFIEASKKWDALIKQQFKDKDKQPEPSCSKAVTEAPSNSLDDWYKSKEYLEKESNFLDSIKMALNRNIIEEVYEDINDDNDTEQQTIN